MIKKYINENFVFIRLPVDVKPALEKSALYFSKILNKEVKTIGQKNLELQIQLYHGNSQQQSIVLNSNRKEISRIAYTKEVEDFKAFLKVIEE